MTTFAFSALLAFICCQELLAFSNIQSFAKQHYPVVNVIPTKASKPLQSVHSGVRIRSYYKRVFMQNTAEQTISSPSGNVKVAILGGGFGGLYTALNLARLAKFQQSRKIDITLVDVNDRLKMKNFFHLYSFSKSGIE